MVTVQIGTVRVNLPDAGEFDLLIEEAERLIGTRGTAVVKGGKLILEASTGMDTSTVRFVETIVREFTPSRLKFWDATRRALRAAWASNVWAVGTMIAQEVLMDAITDAGMNAGMKLATDPARVGPMTFAVGNKLIQTCVAVPDRRRKLMTLHAFEARRQKAQAWLDRVEGWGRRADPYTEGMLKAYSGLVETMLMVMVTAYAQTAMGRGSRRVKTKRVRAAVSVRRPGRPKEDTPRERGEWSKKHPVPVRPS